MKREHKHALAAWGYLALAMSSFILLFEYVVLPIGTDFGRERETRDAAVIVFIIIVLLLCGNIGYWTYKVTRLPIPDTVLSSTSNPEVSRIIQNIAILCRTALVLLTAWIVMRLTWPVGIWETRLVELTVGGVISAIFWFIVSLCAGATLFSFAVNIPARARQNKSWCQWWMGFLFYIVLAYGGALAVLMKPTKSAFYGVIQAIASWMWSLVIL